MRRRKGIIVAILFAITSFAVSVRPALAQSAPANLRVGVLPNGSEAEKFRNYTPLLEHLSKTTGRAFSLVVAQTYDELVELFRTKSIEIANFGGYTFVQAHELYGAVPLVMNDGESRPSTFAVIASNGPLQECTTLDCPRLAQSRLLFGPQLSTSGHLMPRYFLRTERGLVAETFFKDVRYSNNHQATALAIQSGEADVGMIFAPTFRRMVRQGKIPPDALRVIWESRPFPDSVWAVQPSLDANTVTRLRDAFLALDANKSGYAEVLAPMRVTGFLPIADAEFDVLRDAALQLGLSPQERKK